MSRHFRRVNLSSVGGEIDAAALMARLHEVYGAESQEELARALDVPTRSLQRWKAGKGMSFATAVDLLRRAGWLNDGDEGATLSRAQQERARALARELADRLDALVEILG